MDKKQIAYNKRREAYQKRMAKLWADHWDSLDKGEGGLVRTDYPVYVGGYYDRTKRKNGASF